MTVRPAHPVTYSRIPLKQTTLHYVTVGSGEPLVIMPATVSSISNWLGLVKFLSERFTVHFFELPGHGKSTAYPDGYSSQKVADTVREFIDRLGYGDVSLMGFSFGGLLTLTTLQTLRPRVKRVILFAPCVSHRALRFSYDRILLLRALQAACINKRVREHAMAMIHSTTALPLVMQFLHHIGHLETDNIPSFEKKLQSLPEQTFEVLISQIHEILTIEFPFREREFAMPCYFGMSVRDPMLSYGVTADLLTKWFSDITVRSFDFSYHQPKRPYTVRTLERDYGELMTCLR